MGGNDETAALTDKERAEFLAQLNDPESAISRAVRDRAEFIKATETAAVPVDRTVVLNFTSGRLADGSGTDTLLILTPHLVRAPGGAQR